MEQTKKVPVLRFPEFLGEWEVKTLGEVTNFIKDGTHGTHPDTLDGEYLLLSAKNIKDGGIYYDESDRKISKFEFDSIYKNYKLHDGDILLTVVGTIGRVAIYSSIFHNIAFQRSVAFFRLKNENSNFFLQLFQTRKFQNTLLTNQVVSAQAGIYLGDLAKISINFPALPEQQKIADFLTQIDNKINQLSQKKQLLERYKKGVMQQIFSQSIRFTYDDGRDFPEWEEKSLGDVATFSKGKGISKSDINEDGCLECIRYGELYTFYGETIRNIKSKTNIDKDDLVLSKHNDVIIPASGETQLDIAKASCVLKDGVALGGDLNIIRTKLNGVFLSYYLNSTKRQDIASLSQGISVVHLYSSQLKLLDLSIPVLPEQTKIANFLTALDNKIALVESQLNGTKQYKKGLLQQLFV